METKNKLALLYKELYNACRKRVHPNWQNDPDAVKALRDHTTMELCGKLYNDLTEQELQYVLDILDAEREYERPTQNMLKTLKFYMFSVGIIYANMKEWTYYDPNAQVELSGDTLRNHIKKLFENSVKSIPPSIVRRLFEEWINPKSNQFLIEGKYKKNVRNPHMLYYERLTKSEARYLINRYAAIYNQITNKSINELENPNHN